MRRFGYLQASCAFLAAGLVVLVAASARADEDLAPTIQARVEADWGQQDKQFVPAGQRQAVQAAPAASPAAAGGLPGKATTTAQDAAGGCDGVKTGYWGFHTASGEQDPWWQVAV